MPIGSQEMAAAHDLNMSAAGNIASYGVTSLPFDVQWTDGFAAETAMMKHDSCHCPSSSSIVHCGFTADMKCPDVSSSSCLSSDRLGSDSFGSLCSDAMTVTEPCCWNSTSAAVLTACSSSVSCSASTSLLTDNIHHPVSSVTAVEKDFFPTANGIHVVNFCHTILYQILFHNAMTSLVGQ